MKDQETLICINCGFKKLETSDEEELIDLLTISNYILKRYYCFATSVEKRQNLEQSLEILYVATIWIFTLRIGALCRV